MIPSRRATRFEFTQVLLDATGGADHFEVEGMLKSGDLYRVPEIVTRGRFPDEGESDSTWRTQEARHVGSDTIAPGF